MKLLLDENLSYKLISKIKKSFPKSHHLSEFKLSSASDLAVWEYAKAEGFIIVTKDTDFHEMVVLKGTPPKVIWVKRGNLSTIEISELLLEKAKQINNFIIDTDARLLILS